MKHISLICTLAALLACVLFSSCSKQHDAVDYAPENAVSVVRFNLDKIAANPLAEDDYFSHLAQLITDTYGKSGTVGLFHENGKNLFVMATDSKEKAEAKLNELYEKVMRIKKESAQINPALAAGFDATKGNVTLDNKEYNAVSVKTKDFALDFVADGTAIVPAVKGKLLTPDAKNTLAKEIKRNAIISFVSINSNQYSVYTGPDCVKCALDLEDKNNDSLLINATLTYANDEAASNALSELDESFTKGEAPAFMKTVKLLREGSVVTLSFEAKYTVIKDDLKQFQQKERERIDKQIKEIQKMKDAEAKKAKPEKE